MELLPLYERAIERTGTIVADVKPEQLSDPTPCSDWDVRTLINHIIGANYMWAALREGREIDTSRAAPDIAGDDPAGAYQQSAKAALEAFRSPGAMDHIFKSPIGEIPGSFALGVALSELVVHGWDLAKATGQDPTIDEDIVSPLYETAKVSVAPEYRQPPINAFGPEVEVPQDASLTDKFVAFLGRTP